MTSPWTDLAKKRRDIWAHVKEGTSCKLSTIWRSKMIGTSTHQLETKLPLIKSSRFGTLKKNTTILCFKKHLTKSSMEKLQNRNDYYSFKSFKGRSKIRIKMLDWIISSHQIQERTRILTKINLSMKRNIRSVTNTIQCRKPESLDTAIQKWMKFHASLS
jgi:hypothetical protein